MSPQPLGGNKRGKHIAPSHQHYKRQMHRGREGIIEHGTGGRGRKSQREHQLSVEKPPQGSSHQYFCSTCNNRNASKAEDITEWAPDIESDDSEPEQSENEVMERQKRETEGKSHLTEEILELRDNKFNITEEACFRGRSWRSRQCPDIREADCLWVSFSSEEVGNWNRLRRRAHLALPKNVCVQKAKKMRIFFLFKEGHNFKQKLKGKFFDRKKPKPCNWEARLTTHTGFS